MHACKNKYINVSGCLCVYVISRLTIKQSIRGLTPGKSSFSSYLKSLVPCSHVVFCLAVDQNYFALPYLVYPLILLLYWSRRNYLTAISSAPTVFHHFFYDIH